jgi:hypothetical protein
MPSLLQNKSSVDDQLDSSARQILNASDGVIKLTKKLLIFSSEVSFSATETDINQLLRDIQHDIEKLLSDRIELNYELEVDL